MKLNKRIIAIGMMCVATEAWAGSFHIGPMVEYDSFSKGNARFLGIAPHFTFGYSDLVVDCFVLGAELFAGPKTFDFKNSPTNTVSLRTTYNYGASLIPGYIFDNVVMGYLRLGGIRTRFDNLSTVKNGLETGIGMEWLMDMNWSIRGEYDYIRYTSINGVGTVKADVFAIGLKYTFL